ncbi:S2/P23 family protein [Borrelia coriaceae]|uniref:S2/P23 family protein n=1 Tax=Borrelia coriaceae TaxID=144 RepID=UPI00046D1626|nr:S2/P23 family protein [Borrelia coriaceae]
MKKIIILLPLLITCCILNDDFLNLKSQVQQSLDALLEEKIEKILKEKAEQENGEDDDHVALTKEYLNFEILEGTKEKCLCLFCTWWCGCQKKCHITWMKIKAKNIIGENHKPLEDLKGKLRYSYSVSPIKYNDKYSKYVMPLILFESLDENLEVTSFKLTNHINLDFNNKKILGIQGIPQEEKSSEDGYKNVYPYGIVNINPNGGDEILSAFAALYQNGKWNSMEAEIKVKNKNTNNEETHKILLNGKLFNEFIKSVVSKYQGTTTANTKFRVPVNN